MLNSISSSFFVTQIFLYVLDDYYCCGVGSKWRKQIAVANFDKIHSSICCQKTHHISSRFLLSISCILLQSLWFFPPLLVLSNKINRNPSCSFDIMYCCSNGRVNITLCIRTRMFFCSFIQVYGCMREWEWFHMYTLYTHTKRDVYAENSNAVFCKQFCRIQARTYWIHSLVSSRFINTYTQIQREKKSFEVEKKAKKSLPTEIQLL